MLYTFWQGEMPEYIKLCLDTWKVPFTLLNYDNLNQYTDIPIDKLKKFPIMQACDAVRAWVLRDNGGYWLDADSIMVTDKLPEVTVFGDIALRTNTIAYLHTEAHSEMFEKWTEYQRKLLDKPNMSDRWSLMGNDFTDDYIKAHYEINLGSVYDIWAETENDIRRQDKYVDFYFNHGYKLKDVNAKDLLVLHNSWTPAWYKRLTKAEILTGGCTLSNILKELA